MTQLWLKQEQMALSVAHLKASPLSHSGPEYLKFEDSEIAGICSEAALRISRTGLGTIWLKLCFGF